MSPITIIENTTNIIDISNRINLANCIISALLLLVTIISVICAFKAYHHQKNRAKKEAACHLARYYSENIIQRHSFVSNILRQTTLYERIKELFPYDELHDFSKKEAIALIERHGLQYEDISKEFRDIDPQVILNIKMSQASSFSERKDMVAEYIKFDKNAGEKVLVNGILLRQEFFDKMVYFLNDLEWFSMSCRYGICDEEILYQSLHSTFLSCVWQLYFYICDRNLRNEDKLYTNIIWLFTRWRSRLYEIQGSAQRRQAQALKEMRLAEEQCATAKHKLETSEAEIYVGKPLK